MFLLKTIKLFLHPCQLIIILEILLLLSLRPLWLHIEYVGALNSITKTRPNLAYVGNLMSQFMHSPTFISEQFIKSILHYVKDIINFSIAILSRSTMNLYRPFSIDCAGCPDIRHSISRYYTFLDQIVFFGMVRSNLLLSGLVWTLSIDPLLVLLKLIDYFSFLWY